MHVLLKLPPIGDLCHSILIAWAKTGHMGSPDSRWSGGKILNIPRREHGKQLGKSHTEDQIMGNI